MCVGGAPGAAETLDVRGSTPLIHLTWLSASALGWEQQDNGAKL